VQTEELDYDLPEQAIAQHPLAKRDAARMLVLSGEAQALRDAAVQQFADEVPPGALVVLNDTRVLLSRLFAEREGSGGKVELLLLAPDPTSGDLRWEALLRANRTLPVGATLVIGEARLKVGERTTQGTTWVASNVPFRALIERCGHVPLPPYVRRPDDAQDRERYQTVFARVDGSAAAPTAGLHLTPETLSLLRQRGVDVGFVTLHVGAGTFRPVSAPSLREHVMHSERYGVSEELCQQVRAAKERRGPIVAVGTTVVRALESSALEAERAGQDALLSGERATELLISPGFRFRVVDSLLTNFHAPRSTLLALVYAFAGQSYVRAAYQHALGHGYRFLSYGDAMWIPKRCG
jgi:S-adenosylmethionine:tRNA ribosyltransferase-isomerase